jgi:hypothetical protein
VTSELVDVGLIRDAETVSGLSDEIRSGGKLLVCHCCGDVEALIAGFLVLADEQEACALCGSCIRRLPLFGAAV